MEPVDAGNGLKNAQFTLKLVETGEFNFQMIGSPSMNIINAPIVPGSKIMSSTLCADGEDLKETDMENIYKKYENGFDSNLILNEYIAINNANKNFLILAGPIYGKEEPAKVCYFLLRCAF